MKLSNLLIISAVIFGIFGILFVVVPGFILPLYGTMMGIPVAQFFGAELIGIAIVNWFSRNAHEGEALRGILLGNLVSDAIGFVLALYLELTGQMSALGWLTIVIYLVLGLGFGDFLAAGPRVSEARTGQ